HGRFTADSTIQTAQALQCYALGLAAYAGVKVLAPAFYALDQRHLPMIVSLISIAVNFALNWLFTFHLGLGHRGLALSTSFVATTNFLLLYAMMRRHIGRLETRAMLASLGKIALAGAVLGAVCWSAQHFVFPNATRISEWKRIVDVAVTISLGGGAFFATAYLLGIAELREVVTLVRKRFA
ncbi:MAG: lipid II flippase MurJ, partial [Chthoniobacterales bacterium]